MSVVVGYVRSKEGQAALRAAVQECLLRASDLLVVQTPRAGQDADKAAIDDELTAARAQLESAGLALELHEGSEGHDVSDDLIGVAEAANGEVIVIGLRRRSAIGKLILGSNAQRVLLDAPCPVLAVKAEG